MASDAPAGGRPADATGLAGEVPASTLVLGMLTAVAAGSLVGWALLPLRTTVAGLPVYAVAAVATTLWAGISYLRRELPSGVLAEGCYLMGFAVLARPVAVLLSLEGLPDFLDRPGAVFVSLLGAFVVATLLLVAGWRLDTHARKTRRRRMRRRMGRRLAARRPPAGHRGAERADADGSPNGPGDERDSSVRRERER